jgi:DNA-binding response OmpR family regulator
MKSSTSLLGLLSGLERPRQPECPSRAFSRIIEFDSIPMLAPERSAGREERRRSVLVIDDDPEVAPLVRCAMDRYQIVTETAYGGPEGLARIQSRTPDLVLLDLGMPSLDGFSVLRILKADAWLSRLPVIVLSGNSEEFALARSFGYGADDYVTKPFRPSEVAMRAYRLLHPYRPYRPGTF